MCPSPRKRAFLCFIIVIVNNDKYRQVNLVVDMYGCPNRCKHCWLGHMPNRNMEKGTDEYLISVFDPYFERIAYYSWLREPDYCDDYRDRWYRDLEISKNCKPQRFELASFYRIVRDEKYIPFLKEVGTEKVQLTFFGLKDTQDRYVGRKGAFEEVLEASRLLAENGIIPRWQCFINEENKDEIVEIHHMAKKFRDDYCKDLEFFVHEGSCDGENRKLYPIRICKKDIPEELKEVYLDIDELMDEKDCMEILLKDENHPILHEAEAITKDDEITLNISNTFDVYYNFSHMAKEWIIGNLKTDDHEQLIRKIVEGDTYALNEAKKVTWKQLAMEYGDPVSEKAFRLEDYKTYLFNEYLERTYHVSG